MSSKTRKPTRNPLHDDRVGFYIPAQCSYDLEKNPCGIHDTAAGIQIFTLILLLVGEEDLGETISFLHVVINLFLRVGKLGTEHPNGVLEVYYFTVWGT